MLVRGYADARPPKQSTYLQVVDLVRGGLTTLQRGTLGALVVMDVHARDVVAELAKEHVQDVGDFAWQAQLRSYWEGSVSGVRLCTCVFVFL